MVMTISFSFHDWTLLADRQKLFFFPPEYNIHSDEYISRRGVKLSKSESYVPSGKQMMSTVTASLKSVMK